MGKGGEVYRHGGRGDGPTEFLFGLCGAGIIFGILGTIMRMGHMDCGSIPIPKHGVTEPVYSAPELITLMGSCELTSPAEYPMRHYEIRIRDGPCTFEHLRRLYPSPECKRGEERKMAMWGRTSETYTRNADDTAWVPWNVTVRSLCCPTGEATAKGLRDGGDDGDDGISVNDASTQTSDAVDGCDRDP